MMDSRSSFYDLANAPPLLNDSEMEVTMTGEKRKTTPPDLLTLSNMYFEKTQVLFRDPSYLSRSRLSSRGGGGLENVNFFHKFFMHFRRNF